MALSADLFPLCHALACILSTYRPEPLSEESLPPKNPARCARAPPPGAPSPSRFHARRHPAPRARAP
eukprot:2546365-Prymnesium_polylepis.1